MIYEMEQRGEFTAVSGSPSAASFGIWEEVEAWTLPFSVNTFSWARRLFSEAAMTSFGALALGLPIKATSGTRGQTHSDSTYPETWRI